MVATPAKTGQDYLSAGEGVSSSSVRGPISAGRPFMLMETASLVGAIEKWVFAMQCEEFALARTIAKDIISDGTQLMHHADFDRCLRKCFDKEDPQDVLKSLSGLLACISDAREEALRRRSR